jgi:Tol biopolymer transport system component
MAPFIAWMRLRRQPRRRWPPPRRTRLVACSALAAGILVATVQAPATLATFPDRNGLIAFSAATDSGTQVFTVRSNGRGLRQVTHVAGDAINVDWSPDGRRLVFAIITETTATLAMVDANGSHFRVLPQPPDTFQDQPSFSPDGRRIYFERYTIATNDDAIWSMKLDGSDQRRIIGPFPNGAVGDPNVSPDGSTLLFSGFDATAPALGLFTARIDGSHMTQIRPFESDQTIKTDWAPNGRRIATTGNANLFDPQGSPNILTMRPDGFGVRQLTHFHDPDMRAYLGSYSPDGEWLVFRIEDHGQFGLFRMHPDGSDRREILPMGDFKPFLIDWGPRSAGSQHH